MNSRSMVRKKCRAFLVMALAPMLLTVGCGGGHERHQKKDAAIDVGSNTDASSSDVSPSPATLDGARVDSVAAADLAPVGSEAGDLAPTLLDAGPSFDGNSREDTSGLDLDDRGPDAASNAADSLDTTAGGAGDKGADARSDAGVAFDPTAIVIPIPNADAATSEVSAASTDAAIDIPQSPSWPWIPPCPRTGATECRGDFIERVCTSNGWVQRLCGSLQACLAGACRPACADLAVPAASVFTCFSPTDWRPATGQADGVVGLSSDYDAFPLIDLRGWADDTLGQERVLENPAPVASDATGLFWRTDSPSTFRGRLILAGQIDFAGFLAKYGSRPSTVTLYAKLRKLTASGYATPQPLFSLADANGTLITSEIDSAQFAPTTTWTIRSRTFKDSELAAMGQDGNVWTLRFSNILTDDPPETVEVAWFAVVFGLPGQQLDAGAIDGGVASLDAEVEDGGAQDASPSVDNDANDASPETPPPAACPEEGATQCKDAGTLSTCVGGQWKESACEGLRICAEGACQAACPDRLSPTGAVVACYVPVTPEGPGNGTLRSLTSDPVGLPVAKALGGAYEWSDLLTGEPTDPLVVREPVGLVWKAQNWLEIDGQLALDDFKASYGGIPKAITLSVKARKIADSSRAAPAPSFYLLNGANQLLTMEGASRWMTPTTDWAIYNRVFTVAELNALSTDSTFNFWRTIFDSEDIFNPPENVEVAWFAMTLVPPNGTYPLNVSLSGNGVNTVTASSIDLSCTGPCGKELPLGSQVTLTATPDANSVFTGWSGSCTGIGECTLTMNAPKSVTASFATRLTSVTCGNVHSCGVRQDGTAVCWGNNGVGQSKPVEGSYAAVSAGGYHTCGLRKDGEVSCWGYNAYRQATPLPGAFQSLSAGYYHTCGLRSDGTIGCWGTSGNGITSAPVGTFASLSAGAFHTCAVSALDGTLACWGASSYGEISPPVGQFSSVCAGAYFGCALDTSGSIHCWGDNSYGQRTPPSGAYASLGCGYFHACAVKVDGTLVCWGDNSAHQTEPPPGTFMAVSGGSLHTCGLRNDGAGVCWGLNNYGQATAP